jgi:hypothetical protein
MPKEAASFRNLHDTPVLRACTDRAAGLSMSRARRHRLRHSEVDDPASGVCEDDEDEQDLEPESAARRPGHPASRPGPGQPGPGQLVRDLGARPGRVPLEQSELVSQREDLEMGAARDRRAGVERRDEREEDSLAEAGDLPHLSGAKRESLAMPALPENPCRRPPWQSRRARSPGWADRPIITSAAAGARTSRPNPAARSSTSSRDRPKA